MVIYSRAIFRADTSHRLLLSPNGLVMRFATFCCGCLLFVAPANAQFKGLLRTAADTTLTRVEHLHQAAEHLEAAGLKDESQRIRLRATLLQHQHRLEQKLKEAHKLQAEIRELYELTKVGRQVQVDLKVIEVDLDKLEAEGISLSDLSRKEHPTHAVSSTDSTAESWLVQIAGTTSETTDKPPTAKLLDEHGNLTQTSRRLQDTGVVKVIAAPTLITTPGRPANLLSGGEFPIPVPQAGEIQIEWREFGTRVETVTNVLLDGRIRVELQLESAEPDFNNAVETTNGVIPGLTTRRFNTQLVAESGQTTVMGTQAPAQPVRKSVDQQTSGRKQLIVVVTPLLLDERPPLLPTDSLQ